VKYNKKKKWVIPENSMHKRLAQFALLYSSFVTHGNYLFIAHRNMLSVCNLDINSSRMKWKHFEFQDQVRQVFRHKFKAPPIRAKDDLDFNDKKEEEDATVDEENRQVEIGILIGANQLKFLKIQTAGKEKKTMLSGIASEIEEKVHREV